MKLQIKVNESGVIEDARFKTYGCGSAIASSSLVTEWVKGKTLDEALTIRNTQIAEELALPPVKVHCSILAEDAIKAAVQNYKESTRFRPRRRRTENEYGSPRSAARFPSRGMPADRRSRIRGIAMERYRFHAWRVVRRHPGRIICPLPDPEGSQPHRPLLAKARQGHRLAARR